MYILLSVQFVTFLSLGDCLFPTALPGSFQLLTNSYVTVTLYHIYFLSDLNESTLFFCAKLHGIRAVLIPIWSSHIHDWFRLLHQNSVILPSSFSSEMASTIEVSSSSQIPSILTPTRGFDSSALLITRHKLNGNNYLQWSHSLMMFICGKGKDDYLTSVAPKPKTDDPMY